MRAGATRISHRSRPDELGRFLAAPAGGSHDDGRKHRRNQHPLARTRGEHVGTAHRERPPRAQYLAACQEPLALGRRQKIDLELDRQHIGIGRRQRVCGIAVRRVRDTIAPAWRKPFCWQNCGANGSARWTSPGEMCTIDAPSVATWLWRLKLSRTRASYAGCLGFHTVLTPDLPRTTRRLPNAHGIPRPGEISASRLSAQSTPRDRTRL